MIPSLEGPPLGFTLHRADEVVLGVGRERLGEGRGRGRGLPSPTPGATTCKCNGDLDVILDT